jgi:hypothetical protein
MNASALIDELTEAGVRLSLDGGDLVADVLPGVDPTLYRERIQSSKPALLALLRARETIAALANQLEAGWDWLEEHPHHPEHETFLLRWLNRLSMYEQTYTAHHEQGEALCRAS